MGRWDPSKQAHTHMNPPMSPLHCLVLSVGFKPQETSWEMGLVLPMSHWHISDGFQVWFG